MSLIKQNMIRAWIQYLGFTATFAASSAMAMAWQDGLVLPDQPTVPPLPEVTIISDDAQTTSVEEQDPSDQPEEIEGATPLMQGPIHEAFAERFDLDEEEALVIDQQPPEPIDEQPPEYRPDGDDIQWIPGYWGWDIAGDDFVWVSGVWRQIPPGQQWIPGYWTQVDSGFRWVSGFWAPVANPQIVYLPTPPQSIDNGPSSPSPGPNYFWIPGYWLYGNNGLYVWHAGHWHACQTNWVWVPSRYVWTPSGYIYRAGYWDYGVDDRGMLFAPIAFSSGFNRSYRPYYVIETSPLLFANMYVAPGTSYYYFGSCYAHSHRRCYAWVNYYNYGYDPLFSYYAYQPNQRVWLRNVTNLQHQFATSQHSQQRWTVADQMRLHSHHGPGNHHGVNGAIDVNSSNAGLNAMMHVAPVAALALASKKPDFKTPFSVNKAVDQANLVNTKQLNEFAKKRHELEKLSGIGSTSKPGGVVGSLGNNAPLKQVELIKPDSKGSPIPDFKVGAGVNPKTFSQSLGVQINGSTAGNKSSTTPGNIGTSILSNNSTAGAGGSKPNNLNSTSSGRNRHANQAQQISQMLGGTNKQQIDSKSLENIRAHTLGSVSVGTAGSSTGASGAANVTGSTGSQKPQVRSTTVPPLPKNFQSPGQGNNKGGVTNQLGGTTGNTLSNQLGGTLGGQLGATTNSNKTGLGQGGGKAQPGTQPGSQPGTSSGGNILGGNKPGNAGTPNHGLGGGSVLGGGNILGGGSLGGGTLGGSALGGNKSGGSPNQGGLGTGGGSSTHGGSKPGSTGTGGGLGGTIGGGGRLGGGNPSGGNVGGSGTIGGSGRLGGGGNIGGGNTGGGTIGGGGRLGGNLGGGGNIGSGGRPGENTGGNTAGGGNAGSNSSGKGGNSSTNNSGNNKGGKK